MLLLPWASGLGVAAILALAAATVRRESLRTSGSHRPKWIQGEHDGIRPCWGIAGGLLFGIHPGDKKGDGEPRGLIRIYSPVLPGEKYDLINFIAIEPIVAGRRGFSEMERSRLDRRAGQADVDRGDLRRAGATPPKWSRARSRGSPAASSSWN